MLPIIVVNHGQNYIHEQVQVDYEEKYEEERIDRRFIVRGHPM